MTINIEFESVFSNVQLHIITILNLTFKCAASSLAHPKLYRYICNKQRAACIYLLLYLGTIKILLIYQQIPWIYVYQNIIRTQFLGRSQYCRGRSIGIQLTYQQNVYGKMDKIQLATFFWQSQSTPFQIDCCTSQSQLQR